ncbi:hypothetical protein EST62_08110 [Chlorobaculum sp. 24CR]|uniref:hypothetical protein n=1 Tax=Chlorobaculum sp. 24CR TaxID=2508878 RepID=UPI00100AC935|nr:hypothetical protein [Chlorobaculum sp. 24CR]RXK85009.1 hypothetical protein EST62_08110 [Chlorobaculum sp. 24CR]
MMATDARNAILSGPSSKKKDDWQGYAFMKFQTTLKNILFSYGNVTFHINQMQPGFYNQSFRFLLFLRNLRQFGKRAGGQALLK